MTGGRFSLSGYRQGDGSFGYRQGDGSSVDKGTSDCVKSNLH